MCQPRKSLTTLVPPFCGSVSTALSHQMVRRVLDAVGLVAGELQQRHGVAVAGRVLARHRGVGPLEVRDAHVAEIDEVELEAVGGFRCIAQVVGGDVVAHVVVGAAEPEGASLRRPACRCRPGRPRRGPQITKLSSMTLKLSLPLSWPARPPPSCRGSCPGSGRSGCR